ncbi:MAG TPA: hypothetical protein VFT64_08500 [Rickettsiales bacterium]|nr:hypothetical protein [Rickettsiales bacterium]
MSSPEEYQDHIILYIDLLGFKDAIRSNKEIIDIIEELLTIIAGIKREYQIEEIPGNMIEMNPAISTFSDHLVVSYPIAPLKKHKVLDWVIVEFRKIVGSLIIRTLRDGFLLRGSLTLGNIYHHKGIIFGEGLNRAYEMESKVAIYPRIVVSDDVLPIAAPAEAYVGKMIKEDFDGILHLDYLDDTLIRCPSWWRDWVIKLTTHNIDKYKKSDELIKLAKWGWFSRYFKESTASFDEIVERCRKGAMTMEEALALSPKD